MASGVLLAAGAINANSSKPGTKSGSTSGSDSGPDSGADNSGAAGKTRSKAGPKTGPKCTKSKYIVYFIDPSTHFLAPPLPIESHAQKIICSRSHTIRRLVQLIRKSKPSEGHVDPELGRIKIVIKHSSRSIDNSIIIQEDGEVSRGNHLYTVDRELIDQLLEEFRQP
jgi:hypothetical protein